MYVDPFWFGVVVTILVEVVILISAAVVVSWRKK